MPSPLIRSLAALLVAAWCGIAHAQTVGLSPLPVQHFVDSNGVALAGGKLFTYSAGTTSKLATYTDSTGATPNTNPIILNSRGEANVWLSAGTSYKFVLAAATSADPPSSPIWTVDNIASLPVGITGASTAAITAAGTAFYVKANGTTTAAQIYAMIGGGFTTYDAIQSVITVNPGTTVTGTNALGVYLLNNQASTAGLINGVGLFSVTVAAVNGAFVWPANFIATDDTNPASSGTGGNRLMQFELDYNLNHVDTTVNGIVINSIFRAQPTTARGFVLNTIINGVQQIGQFTQGILIQDGATSGVALEVGAANYNLASQNSQSVVFDYLDPSVIKRNYSIRSTVTNGLQFGSTLATSLAKFTFNGNVYVPSTNGFYVNGLPILTGDTGATVNLAPDPTNTTVNIGNQTAVKIVAKGLPTTCTAMASGELWNNANVINICP